MLYYTILPELYCSVLCLMQLPMFLYSVVLYSVVYSLALRRIVLSGIVLFYYSSRSSVAWHSVVRYSMV